MKRSMLKILLLGASISMAGVLSAQSTGPNATKTPEPLDAHDPFPTKEGMSTPAPTPKVGGKDGTGQSRMNKDIPTKRNKVPAQPNGTDILNNKKGKSGSTGYSGGDTNIQNEKQ